MNAKSTLKWGLIGCGDVARKRVAQAIQQEPHSQLVAACRRDQTKLQEFCQAFQVPRSYPSHEELLADSEIDVVYIATPVCEHLPQTLASAQAGKHVLVEKPMAMTTAECDQMIAACQERGVKLSVAYYRRFYPLIRRIKNLMAAGEIGKPLAASAVTATSLNAGEFNAGEFNAGELNAGGQQPNWRVVLEQGGGGALMDIGSHRINVLLHLFGPAVEVQAFVENVASDYQAEDSATLLLKFQSGLVATLQCHFGSTVDPDELSILGTRGRLIARPLNGDELIVQRDQLQHTEIHPPAPNLCAPLVADFASAILEDRDPIISGHEGRTTNAVIEQAYRLTGKTSQDPLP